MALTAVGVDQPGIVAALTGALEALGCNLEDSTMSILRGHFAVLLVIEVPAALGAEAVESALASVASALDLVVSVRPMREVRPDPDRGPADPGRSGEVYAFSIHGADHPGIVHRAARVLAEAGGNVLDLSTRLVGSVDRPVYVLHLTVGFPPGLDADAAADAVRDALAELGVQSHAHPVEVDVL